jgi:uncharacterized membrane protein YoaK (UPF0700 family)
MAPAGTVLSLRAGRRHVPVGILAVALVLLVPVAERDWSIRAMAFAMGMLNATIRQTGSVDVAITYVTGTLAKVGRGLGLLLCGRSSSDWSWLQQAVPWAGLVAGAAAATFALLRVGERPTLIALPLIAALIGLGTWLALPTLPPQRDPAR